jgi:glycosyltransferase involved in cell wall biosynthesis
MIFIFTEVYKIGGIQKYNKNIVDFLIRENIKAICLSLNDEINFKKNYLIFKGFKKNKIKFFIFSIFYSLKNKKIIIGHLNFSPIIIFIKIFNPFSKIFLILHGIECFKKLNIFKKLNLLFVNNFISVSNFTKDKFLENNKFLKNKKFFILPTYIEFKEKIDYENLPEGKIMLSVSRLDKSEKYKGIDKVIKVMPDILKEIKDVYYIIVGDGDDRENLEKLCQKLNLKERVIFKGFVSEEKLNFYYKNCDLFILPSKKEGFGIVFLEALSFGKIVIAGNKDGSKEALLDGEVGILIDPDNIYEIKETILKVLKKEIDKRFFDGNFLKNRILEEFNFEKFKERIKFLI